MLGEREIDQGNSLALFSVAAGVVASLMEPGLDSLSSFWYAPDNVAVVFTAFGIPVPLFVMVGYGFFYGAQAYIGFQLILRGASGQALWRLYAFAWLLNLSLEIIGSQLNVFTYYGDQHVLKVFGVPVVFMFINATLPILTGGLFYITRRWLAGLKAALAIPLLTFAFGALYMGSGWPYFLAINSEAGPLLVHVAAVVTALSALGLCQVVIRIVALDRSKTDSLASPLAAVAV